MAMILKHQHPTYIIGSVSTVKMMGTPPIKRRRKCVPQVWKWKPLSTPGSVASAPERLLQLKSRVVFGVWIQEIHNIGHEAMRQHGLAQNELDDLLLSRVVCLRSAKKSLKASHHNSGYSRNKDRLIRPGPTVSFGF